MPLDLRRLKELHEKCCPDWQWYAREIDLGEMSWDDCELAAAARNALPALLAIAEAAELVCQRMNLPGSSYTAEMAAALMELSEAVARAKEGAP